MDELGTVTLKNGATAKIVAKINILQVIEAAVADYTEFESGAPVAIQFDPISELGVQFDFTPGNIDLTIPEGTVFAIPFYDVKVTFPLLGPVLLSAETNAITVQKAPS